MLEGTSELVIAAVLGKSDLGPWSPLASATCLAEPFRTPAGSPWPFAAVEVHACGGGLRQWPLAASGVRRVVEHHRLQLDSALVKLACWL